MVKECTKKRILTEILPKKAFFSRDKAEIPWQQNVAASVPYANGREKNAKQNIQIYFAKIS